MDQIYTATKRSTGKHEFAFMFSSNPSTEDAVIDGDDPQGVIDAENPT